MNNEIVKAKTNDDLVALGYSLPPRDRSRGSFVGGWIPTATALASPSGIVRSSPSSLRMMPGLTRVATRWRRVLSPRCIGKWRIGTA